MRTTSKLLAIALTAALQPAIAGTVALDFEDVTTNVMAGDRYSSQGVSFSGDAWAVRSRLDGCGSVGLSFSRTGSCGALLLAAAGSAVGNPTSSLKSFVIDVADGFVDELSFFYGVRSLSNVTITVFEDLGGSGKVLFEQLGLPGEACSTGGRLFCDPAWYQFTSDKFSGVGHSVVISGVDQRLILDDLKFTTRTTGNLPEPTSVALVLGALGAMGWSRRRFTR